MKDVTDGVTALCSSGGQLIAVVVGDAADKVDLFVYQCVGQAPAFVFIVRHFTFEWVDVAAEELGKAVDEEGVDGRMLPMACAEGA